MSASRAVWSISWAPVRITDTAESKGDVATVPFFVKKDICEKEMGLELRLEWYAQQPCNSKARSRQEIWGMMSQY